MKHRNAKSFQSITKLWTEIFYKKEKDKEEPRPVQTQCNINLSTYSKSSPDPISKLKQDDHKHEIHPSAA